MNTDRLEKKLEALENLINNGDMITLPYRQMSMIVDDLNKSFDKNARMLEAHQNQIDKFNKEAIKARNQIVYMFLVLLATLVAKSLLPHLIGQ